MLKRNWLHNCNALLPFFQSNGLLLTTLATICKKLYFLFILHRSAEHEFTSCYHYFVLVEAQDSGRRIVMVVSISNLLALLLN